MIPTIDTKINAKEIIFKDLFDTKFLFKIPGYQRQFSWEKDNFEQLFDDINDAMENDESSYFLGSVILQVLHENADGSGYYDVVDGQQRLTTLTILLAVMRDLIEEPNAKLTLQRKIFQEANPFEDKPETVRLQVRERDFDFYKKYILAEGGTLQLPNKKDLNEPQGRMFEAINVFSNKFMDKSGVNEHLLKSMIYFILNRCMFVYVKTGTFTSAFRLFSILNDRGMPLSNADLLKSSNLGAIPEGERKKYQKIWENIEEELNREELEKLLGFIRLIFVKEKARKSIMEEYEEKVFTKKPDFRGKAFIEYVQNFANIYREKILDASLNANDSTLEVKYHRLISLMRDYIPASDWLPVFISFVQKFDDEKDIYHFLTLLEKRFIVSWIKGITPTNRVTETVKMIQSIEKSQTHNEVYQSDIFNTKQDMKDVHYILDRNDFYKKKFAKYLLLRLDMILSENSNVKKSYTGTISVEHILPQNPSRKSSWMTLFTDNERIEYTHKLGNLVLLSRIKNSSANNKEFQVKLDKYFSKGITDFDLTRELKKYKTWDREIYLHRHEDLLNRLIKIYF